MFDALSDRLERIAGRLRSRGRLTDADLDEALAGDPHGACSRPTSSWAWSGASSTAVRARCSPAGPCPRASRRASRSSRPCTRSWSQILGGETLQLTYASRPPTVVLLAGLQGSGKTTTVGQAGPLVEAAGPQSTAGRGRPPAPGRRGAAAGARRPGGVTVFSEPTDPVAVAAGRPRGGPPAGPRRVHHRHGRPPGHRRRADGRGAADLGGRRARTTRSWSSTP